MARGTENPVSSEKPNLPDCKVKKTIVERLEVVGPSEIFRRVLDELYDKGFNVVHSGPYTDKKLHPRVDVKRFQLFAERVMH